MGSQNPVFQTEYKFKLEKFVPHIKNQIFSVVIETRLPFDKSSQFIFLMNTFQEIKILRQAEHQGYATGFNVNDFIQIPINTFFRSSREHLYKIFYCAIIENQKTGFTGVADLTDGSKIDIYQRIGGKAKLRQLKGQVRKNEQALHDFVIFFQLLKTISSTPVAELAKEIGVNRGTIYKWLDYATEQDLMPSYKEEGQEKGGMVIDISDLLQEAQEYENDYSNSFVKQRLYNLGPELGKLLYQEYLDKKKREA